MLFFLLYNQDQYGKVLTGNTKLGCNYNRVCHKVIVKLS